MEQEAQGNKETSGMDECKALLRKCLDAPGYVILAARLTNNTDEKGNRIIEFDYRRYQMSFDDVKKAIREFIHQFDQDVERYKKELLNGIGGPGPEA